jgi:putative PIN family toxin of toxin-antitoxin system
MRVVVDSNVFVSALIAPNGTSGSLVRKLVESRRTVFLISRETMEELKRVLMYPKIARLLKWSSTDVDSFISSIELIAEEVDVAFWVSNVDCRDPDDIKFLSLAVAGRADFLVTGDEDLLILKTIADIPVLSPSQCLSRIEEME